MLYKILLTLGWLLVSCGTISATADIRSGDELPPFSVVQSDGEKFTSSTLGGKPTVIVFFHTACWDCRKELPALQQLYERYGASVRFLCISRAEPAAFVADYWQRHRLTLPYAAQEDREVFQLFAERTIPRLYICDAEGQVRRAYKGQVSRRKLERGIRSVMKSKQIKDK